MVSLVAQRVKNLTTMQETWVQSLGWEDPLEKGKATHSSILAWRIQGLYSSRGLQELDTTEQSAVAVLFLQLQPLTAPLCPLWRTTAKAAEKRLKPLLPAPGVAESHRTEGTGASLMAQTVKNPPAMQETPVHSLGGKDLEKGMATHSSILAWRIPWTEEPGGLQSTGSQRVGHN